MKSMWTRGGLSWVELGRRVWREIQEDDIFGGAAELSYYFLLALFPFLIFITSTIGIVIGGGTGTRHMLFDYLARIMPASAFQLIDSTMRELSQNSGGGKISFGILATLWAASNGMGAITKSLNVAYDVKESRPWWKQRLTAVILTFALSILAIVALVLVVAGGHIADGLAHAYGWGSLVPIVWRIAQWPIALFCMSLAFGLIYYLAPDLHDVSWRWLTPGAAFGVVVWLLVSFALRLYLHFFDSYSATYGSLGAVIILMLWLYLTGTAILIGGEVNSEIENAAAQKGEADAKEKGEKSPSDRQAA
jgi:membrane protein